MFNPLEIGEMIENEDFDWDAARVPSPRSPRRRRRLAAGGGAAAEPGRHGA